MSQTTDLLIPVADLIARPTDADAGTWRRKLHRWCRDGRIAGAIKIGRQWFVRTAHGSPDVEDIAAQLRTLGFAT